MSINLTMLQNFNNAGNIIGSYRVVRLLGAGGMGTVYEVAPLSGGKSSALKIFTSIGAHADFLRKRFIAEGKILKRLNHPNLVKVHDLALDDSTGAPYFTMDVVLGSDGKPCTLEDLRRRCALDEQAVAALYSDLRSALTYLHGEGVVHRDIKLENVLVNAQGRAVLSDFGVSRIVKPDLRRYLAVTTTFAEERAPIMGSAGYLSPELKSGAAAAPADDAWALGILIFRLLTGVWYEERTAAMDLLAGFDRKWTKLLNVLLNAEPKKRLPLPQAPVLASPRRRILKRVLLIVAAGTVLALGIAFAAACFSKPHYDFDEFFPPEKEEVAP